MEEYNYICPHCFTSVSALIDTTIKEQKYIEDCERCCNPVEIKLRLDSRNKVSEFSADRLDA